MLGRRHRHYKCYNSRKDTKAHAICYSNEITGRRINHPHQKQEYKHTKII
jgi:hypothetical protein